MQHDSMEFFGARAQRPLETCLAEVRRSNVLVVIVGHRYGSMVPDLNISFPHAEYNEAFLEGKPCLVYFRDDDVPVLPRHIERDPDNIRLLDEWKDTLRKRHTVSTFRDSPQLAVQVSADLGRTLGAIEQAKQAVRTDFLSEAPTVWDYVRLAMTEALARGVPESSLLGAVQSAVTALSPPRPSEHPSVFVSFAPAKGVFAARLVDSLRNERLLVFDKRTGQIAQSHSGDRCALDDIDCFVFLVSHDQEWVQNEWTLAVYRRVAITPAPVIIPVLLETAEMPPLFRDVLPVDVRSLAPDEAVARVVATVRHRLPTR